MEKFEVDEEFKLFVEDRDDLRFLLLRFFLVISVFGGKCIVGFGVCRICILFLFFKGLLYLFKFIYF